MIEKLRRIVEFDLDGVLTVAEAKKFLALYEACKQLGCGQGTDCMGFGFTDVEAALTDLEKEL
jgi:beta-phosphoglucomutase-like phosphatase (HAD superfamily)